VPMVVKVDCTYLQYNTKKFAGWLVNHLTSEEILFQNIRSDNWHVLSSAWQCGELEHMIASIRKSVVVKYTTLLVLHLVSAMSGE
jgi:hypothetical protein